MDIALEGGAAAGDARRAVESRTGVPVITSKNAAQFNQVVTDMIVGVVTEQDDDTEPEK